MLSAGILALITGASVLEVIFTGVCAIQQAKDGAPLAVRCPSSPYTRLSQTVKSGPDAIIPAHHAFMRIPTRLLTKDSQALADARFAYEEGSDKTDFSVFLADGWRVLLAATGKTMTGLTLKNHIEMAAVCKARKLKEDHLKKPKKGDVAFRFDWDQPASLGSRWKDEQWKFDPPIEGGAAGVASPLAQEIYFRLALEDDHVSLNARDLEDNDVKLPAIELDLKGGLGQIWIGNAPLSDILMQGTHLPQQRDTHFEIIYDLVNQANHSGKLHVPQRVGGDIRDMHGSNCPPIVFRDNPEASK
jgi:hypothetical protein